MYDVFVRVCGDSKAGVSSTLVPNPKGFWAPHTGKGLRALEGLKSRKGSDLGLMAQMPFLEQDPILQLRTDLKNKKYRTTGVRRCARDALPGD